MAKGDPGATHTLLLFALLLKSALELWLEIGDPSVMHSACISVFYHLLAKAELFEVIGTCIFRGTAIMMASNTLSSPTVPA